MARTYLLSAALGADWQITDRSWPLCGRIADTPPTGWVPEHGCPDSSANTAAAADLPLGSTYGPRHLATEDDRYDWHRGIDIPAPCGTPVFAVAAGTVMVAGDHASYRDPVLRIQHARAPACEGGCFHSEYQHIAESTVSIGDKVERGDLIGFTGYSGVGEVGIGPHASVCAVPHDGYEHLHLEVREAPADDKYSSWLADTIHPLSMLPYPDEGTRNLVVRMGQVTTPEPGRIEAEVYVGLLGRDELDVASVHVRSFVRTQQGYRPWSAMPAPDARYLVNPPVLDFQKHTRMWSHKDSHAAPWTSFDDCPFADQHGHTYSADIHVDAASPDTPGVGSFNGLRIWPFPTNAGPLGWGVGVQFTQLDAPLTTDGVCVVAWARDVLGQPSRPAVHCL